MTSLRVIGIRDFSRSVSRVVESLAEDRAPVLITHHGKPTAVLLPVSDDLLQDLLLENATAFLEQRKGRGRDSVIPT